MRTAHRAPTPDAIAPDGVAIRTLIDEVQGARKLSLAEGTVGPNQRSQKVYHTTYEEIWYFLQGQGIFHLHAPGADAEESTPVWPGDAVLVPPTYGFWVQNTSTDELVFLLAGSPPWGAGQEVHPWTASARPAGEIDT
ncbi:MAG TPA: cupin domain-containing protein [Ktedonobacterales bacterium]|nr:cupin domain-containing protein [Ktedonobacterales bacterium]